MLQFFTNMKKNSLKNSLKGFTLIELLVVIAIIGILAGVVLIALSGARSKAQDVKVISDVKHLRDTFEADLSGSAFYPDLTNTSPIYGGLDPNAPGTSTINILVTDLLMVGSSLNIVNTPATGAVLGYAIYAPLVSSTTAFYCMDSSGKVTDQATTNTGATCP